MNPSRLLQPTLLAVTLVAIAGYAAADANLALLVLAVPGAIAAWWLTKGTPPRAMPRTLINALLVGAVGYAVLRVTRGQFEVEAFSEFVTLLLIVKLLDRRAPRDDAQVLTLSSFLAVGAMLTSNALAVGALLMLFVPVLMAAVVLQQLDAVARRAPGDRFRDHASGRAQRLGKDTRRLVAGSWLAAMLLSLLAFILMPRGVGTSAFGQWGNAAVGSVVGFNDEINLGTGGLISQSPEPVMDVRVLDPDGRNAGAPLRTFYLRGAVLDSYESGRWVRDVPLRRSGNESGPLPFGAANPMLIGGTPMDWTYEMRITLRQGARNGTHLFTVWRPERLLLGTSVQALYHDLRDGTLLVTGQEGKIEYTVWCDDRDDTPREEGGALSLVDPIGSEPIAELARRVLNDAGIPVDPDERDHAASIEAARIIEGHFTRERFQYDLDEPSVPRRRDPTEYFLFTTRRGHCEYYASAMTAMCRAVGIPARVVTGYVASEFNDTTGHYLVRASNAHAWVEAEVTPGLWRPFDPTPREDFGRLHETRDDGLIARARRAIETIEFAWIRGVVGFDDETRARLLGERLPGGLAVRDGLMNVLDRIQIGGYTLVRRALGNAAITFATVLILATLANALLTGDRPLARWLRRLAGALLAALGSRRPSPGQDDAPLLRLARRDLARSFRRLGIPRPAWRPLLEHASDHRVASAAGAESATVIERVARSVYRVRFGGAGLDEADRDRLRSDLKALRGAGRS